MVVKLFQSSDLDDLEKTINDFIVDKDNEFIKENPDSPRLSFHVDVKVIPGFLGPKVVHDEYFIAVIQY